MGPIVKVLVYVLEDIATHLIIIFIIVYRAIGILFILIIVFRLC